MADNVTDEAISHKGFTMFKPRHLALLSSVAFDSGDAPNKGALAWARYFRSPNPLPLIRAIEALETHDTKEIEKRTADLQSMVPYWDMVDIIIEGYDAVVAAGEMFLPMFQDEEATDYDERKKFTKFTNVYLDIVESLSEKPFEEEITFVDGTKVPEAIKDFAEDVDGDGNNMTVFAATTFFNGINSAIDWIFVDYPIVDNTVIRTVADLKSSGIRPFWSHVLGRNILEAKSTVRDGKRELTYIRVFECGVGEPDRIRIFEMDEQKVVHWALYEKNEEKKDEYKRVAEGTLSIPAIPFVPFITGKRYGTTWRFRPPMKAAVDLQRKLYQAESALEFVTTLAGYPMLAANGISPEIDPSTKKPKKLAVGPSRVLYSKAYANGQYGEWAYVEPSAQTLEFQQKKIEKTTQDLRELGKQPLTAQSGNLTVITTAVAAGKAQSACSAWALMLKDALENAFIITGMYLKTPADEVEINVYNDFDSYSDSTNDLSALAAARMSRDISRKTYTAELKRRKTLSPEYDHEKDMAELLKEIPTGVDLEDEDDKNTDQP